MTMVRAFLIVLGLCSVSADQAAVRANPIRKIVTLLQNMQKEIEAEGAKEKELFDKFMCFCSGNNGALAKSAADSQAKIEELTAKVQQQEAERAQNDQDVVQHKQEREQAGKDLEEGTVIRKKEQAEYEEMAADSKTNIASMASAIPALEKGMGGASLMQLPEGNRLRKLVANYPSVSSLDRKNVLAFLEESGDYVPQSGQIVGILKGMKDDMEASLKEATADEERAVAGFADLKASKEKEVEMASEAVETKTARAGELAVEAVQTKDALEDEKVELAGTQKFLNQLDTECATKEKEWAERQNMRAEEVKAISEAISILNDDDALDVFKKAVPSALLQESVGFLQRSGKSSSMVQKAQTLLATVNGQLKSKQLTLVLFTLNSKLRLAAKGKTQNFAGVIKMIDDMVTILGKDQADDDSQKVFCEDELDKAGDEKKAATTKLSEVNAAIQESADAIASLVDDIATLTQEIKDLDKSVAEATEQRKEEHEDFLQSQQLNEAATQLLEKAKNRMNKFYNPSLYKAAPVTEMTGEEKIIQAGTFAQIQSHVARFGEDSDVAPPPAPETFGAYEKKGEKSAGVIGLMDMMIKELGSDVKDSQYEEKTSQADYQKLMSDAQEQRSADSKGLVTKNAQKAEMEGKLQGLKDKAGATQTDLDLVESTLGDLHTSCDFLLQNHGLRKEARTNELESLKNAKAILSGANFGL